MPLRRTDPDPEREQAVTDARTQLLDALILLSDASRVAARSARNKRSTPDLTDVVAAFRATERAEEALDLALLDRDTAAGADA